MPTRVWKTAGCRLRSCSRRRELRTPSVTCRQSRSKTAGTLARARLRVCFLLHYINPKHESIMGLGVMSWLKVAEFICNIDWVLVEVAQLRSQSARGQDFSVLFLLQKSAGILEDALSPKSSDSAVELSDQLWSSGKRVPGFRTLLRARLEEACPSGLEKAHRPQSTALFHHLALALALFVCVLHLSTLPAGEMPGHVVCYRGRRD